MKRVICIGSGLAAINFAMCLDESIELIWVLSETATKTNSYLAKGGIAISLDPADSDKHYEDTINAGAGLVNASIAKEVVFGSAKVFANLKNRGVLFDSIPSREGGHSNSRIQHISDQTGKFLVEKLWVDALKRKNTQFLFGWVFTKLKIESNKAVGAQLTNIYSGETKVWFASSIILATGGSGNLYQHHTNGPEANGEGCGIASIAGATIDNLEFVQFHPTRLYSENPTINVLVTEAFRGAGAKLQNHKDISFMQAIHPMGSLAPRDIVSLGIYNQMEHEKEQFVWLDFSKIDDHFFKSTFPFLYQVVCSEPYFKKHKMPITPAAHYQCGGILVDSDAHTSIKGFFALGEVANTGLHGANRLASNSLLELFYFSEKLANNFNVNIENGTREEQMLPSISLGENEQYNQLFLSLKEIMWHSFGIVRNAKQMENGLLKINQILTYLENNPTINLTEVRLINRLYTAQLIAKSAIKRTISLGCHQLEVY
ncbi:MAG: FAD-binding protein [bacterium]|nr:FAD-binding protein [bacterium]